MSGPQALSPDTPGGASPASTGSLAHPPTGTRLHLYSCRTCGRVSELIGTAAEGESLHCPRCDTALHHRRPGSLAATWAFTLAAIILYIPANTLPIMATSSVFGGTTSHTILGGIEELRANGDWLLALIVFIASIAVPMLKIGALILLSTTAQRGSRWKSLERAQLFRMVEAVGHWSMLDVFVVVLLVGMIRFGAFANVQPEPGLLAFGGVVVLTMLATESFDPRLLWPEEEPPAEPSAPPPAPVPPAPHA